LKRPMRFSFFSVPFKKIFFHPMKSFHKIHCFACSRESVILGSHHFPNDDIIAFVARRWIYLRFPRLFFTGNLTMHENVLRQDHRRKFRTLHLRSIIKSVSRFHSWYSGQYF
jgi:hypothetical protein